MTTKTTQPITLRRGTLRGTTDIDWLKSRHSFSFGGYYEPAREQYRSLRVINDDVVAPGGGFPHHPHRDMEILTWVLQGKLRHRDSMGHEGVIGPGELQAMSAGKGILHSEFNDSKTEPVHLLQIWLYPDRNGHTPRYDQRMFPIAEKHNRWLTVASGSPTGDALPIHQDATLLVARLDSGQAVPVTVPAGRFGYLHVARGKALAGHSSVEAGDALEITGPVELNVIAQDGEAELLFFDLA